MIIGIFIVAIFILSFGNLPEKLDNIIRRKRMKGVAYNLAELSLQIDRVEKMRIELQEAEKTLASVTKKRQAIGDKMRKKYDMDVKND